MMGVKQLEQNRKPCVNQKHSCMYFLPDENILAPGILVQWAEIPSCFHFSKSYFLIPFYFSLPNIPSLKGRGTGRGHWGTVPPPIFENKKMRPFFD
jgi:hypothetical protein